MGLDAFVACNCLRDGKLSNPLEPFTMDDVYRDAEGLLSSRMLDCFLVQLGFEEYMRCYGALDRRFSDWLDKPCEHEGREYLSECVSNWSGIGQFRSIVASLGGEVAYPILSHLLPGGDGGSFPAELAAEAIEEIDELVEFAKHLVFNSLVCEGFEEPIWSCADRFTGPFMMAPYLEVGMDGDRVYFATEDRRVTSRRFRQEPIGPAECNGSQEMEITVCETGERLRIFDSIGPSGEPKTVREFWIELREAPFMYEGRYLTAERIGSLLAASLETGNPVQWC